MPPDGVRMHDLGHVVDVRSVRVVEAHVDVVLVAGLLVGERDRRELGVADQAGEHGLRHLLLGEPSVPAFWRSTTTSSSG